MPLYKYNCPECSTKSSISHSIHEDPPIECPSCATIMERMICAPYVCVPIQHRSSGSKLDYYGVNQNGKGIEKLDKDWLGYGKPGIKIKPPKGK